MPYPALDLYPAPGLYPASGFALPPLTAQGRPDEVWLACQLHYFDGQYKRFGPDERDDADVPYQIQFDTQMPGGFGSGSLVLPRPPRLRADDASLFCEAIIYGPHGTVYEGRVVGIPQVGSDEIRLELEPWSEALTDDETFRQVFRDIDLSRWEGPSLQRQINLAYPTSFYVGEGPSVVWDTTSSNLELAAIGPWDLNHRPAPQAWYRSPVPLKRIDYSYKTIGNTTNAAFRLFVHLSDDDVLSASDQSADLHGAAVGSGTVLASTESHYWALVEFYDGSAGGASTVDNEEFKVFFSTALYGNHALTPESDGGFLGSDIIAYALDRSAPDLTYTLGDSIETSTLTIPHLTFLEPTTARSVVEQVTAIGGAQFTLNDWGVFDRRGFFHRSPRSYGRTWRIRKDQVATPTSSGPQAKDRTAGFMVSYRDGSGKAHTVGPPGSGADHETTDLLDTDPQNPANRLKRKFRHRQVGITNQEGAIRIGQVLLASANRLDWQGSVDVRGEATDAQGNKHPVSAMRAGDWLAMEDEEGLLEEQPVVKTSHSHSDLVTQVDIGRPPDTAEVLIGQLEAATDLAVA